MAAPVPRSVKRYADPGEITPLDIDPYREYSSNPGIELGQKVDFVDGTRMRFVGVGGAAITIGEIVAYGGTPLDIEASSYVFSATTYDGTEENRPTLELGTGTITASAYDGGYVGINTSTGAGQMRPIAHNTTSLIRLEFPLTTAISATSHAVLFPNPYNDVKKSTASGSNFDACLGIAPIAFTADYYGWIITRGWAYVEASASLTKGLGFIQGTTAGSALIAATGAQARVLGDAVYTSVTAADFMLCKVCFE